MVDGFVTGPASGGVSGTSEVEVLKPTGVVEVVATSLEAVAVLLLCHITMAICRRHL